MPNSYMMMRDGNWGLRVIGDSPPRPGEVVNVTKKNGQMKVETVAEVIWTGKDNKTGDTVHLCSIGHSQPRKRYVSSYGEGRYCKVCHHRPDDCSDMDCCCQSCGGMRR